MRRLLLSILATLLSSFPVFAVPLQDRGATAQPPSTAAQADLGDVKVEENVVYGSVNGHDLRLDIYEPANDHGTAARPALLLIHGGGWTAFDKSTMRRMGGFLARNGFVAFAVDYRLFDGKENRWPTQFDDVQRAVRWVRANASKYNINPDRIGAFGHSAGGQLAALLGMEDTRDNSDPSLAKYSSRVQAVVDVSAPSDFTVQDDPGGVAFLTSFLGTDYKKNPEVWRDASPVFHVDKKDAVFLIVHGTKDEEVPVSQAQELNDKLAAAGAKVKLVKIDDVHTFETPAARRELALDTLEFFNHYVAGLQ
ncbi:MAG TPA: alpha/beta hydrolase [Terriglobales bacterium]|nr:alpha/beta hydrolase [Terriglobales bacterium]